MSSSNPQQQHEEIIPVSLTGARTTDCDDGPPAFKKPRLDDAGADFLPPDPLLPAARSTAPLLPPPTAPGPSTSARELSWMENHLQSLTAVFQSSDDLETAPSVVRVQPPAPKPPAKKRVKKSKPVLPKHSETASIPRSASSFPRLAPATVDANGGVDEAGGIFDDADDDNDGGQLQLPRSASSLPQASEVLPSPNGPGSLAPKEDSGAGDRRSVIRNIVTGSPGRVIPPGVVGSGLSVAKADTIPVKPRKKRSEVEPKYKKPLQGRILISRKESELATAFFAGKCDLSECLHSDDCLFLADKFWIFTVEQLEFALQGESADAETCSSILFDEILSVLTRYELTAVVNEGQTVTGEHHLQFSWLNGPDVATPVGNDSLECPETMEVDVPVHPINANEPQLSLVDVDHDLAALKMGSGGGPGGEETAQSLAAFSNVPAHAHENQIQKVRDKVAGWKEAVSKFRSAASTEVPMDKYFRLDGAIKNLLPSATRNFLLSIKVESIWKFFAMRKTETGALCELLSIWRRECYLPPLPAFGQARHLVAVASRIETALSAIPPVVRADRAWMMDPINVLTGAAREFLIDHQKIGSAAVFVQMRTKDVSILLESWRKDEGMPELKGSGNVAMISSWKTSAKEALEAEAHVGKVVDMSRTMKTTMLLDDEIISPVKAPVDDMSKMKGKKTKQSRSSGHAKVDYALYAKRFLGNVLGREAANLLKKAEILTAAELFDADMEPDSSSLYRVLVKSGKIDSTLAFNKIIDKWRKALRRNLDQLGIGTVGGASSSINEKDEAKHPPHVWLEADGPRGVSPRQSQSSAVKPFSVSSTSIKQKNKDDAIESLSAVTKKILSSIGIKTAVEFLSSRSTDVAEKFKAWRIAERKTELKGLGAIASVSGWKATVRKRAKELGL